MPISESPKKTALCRKDLDLTGFIDDDILNLFDGTSVFYGDIINAQLIKTNRELIQELRKWQPSEVES
jgi:hypothetical protein